LFYRLGQVFTVLGIEVPAWGAEYKVGVCEYAGPHHKVFVWSYDIGHTLYCVTLFLQLGYLRPVTQRWEDYDGEAAANLAH